MIPNFDYWTLIILTLKIVYNGHRFHIISPIGPSLKNILLR